MKHWRLVVLFLGLLVASVAFAPAVAQGPPGKTPHVLNVTPRSGSTAGGYTITIDGTGLAGATTVLIDTGPITPSVQSDSRITITAPAHDAGVVHLRVLTPFGLSPEDADDDFTYVNPGELPLIQALVPSAGPTAGGTVIQVYGQNFTGAQYVDFDGKHVLPANVSDTRLQVVSPEHAPGVIHVHVVTDAGMSPETANCNFTYVRAPVVTAVTPGQGSTAGGTTVTILGTDLGGASAVQFGDASVAPSQVSATRVVAVSPAHAAGVVHVRVQTAGGLSATSMADQFVFVSGGPIVTGIDPTSGPTQGGNAITIAGTGFTGASAVRFGTDAVAPYSVTDTRVVVIAPAHGAGLVHLRVVTNVGTSPETDADNYTYVSGVPVVTGVSPRSGPVEGGTSVTVTGTGFSGTTAVHFDGTNASITSITDTRVVVATPPHAAGLVHVQVTTRNGTSAESVLDDFTFGGGGPRITAIAPTSGTTAGGTVVTITGTGFNGATGVAFGDQLVAPMTVSNTEVTVSSPAHAAGTVHLRVVAPGGTSPETTADDFTYRGGPVVASISPNIGSVNGGTDITITGGGFTGATSVSFGDTQVAPYSVTDTVIHVVSPRLSTASVVHLHVTTPFGTSGETSADNFTYVARPRVTAVTPAAGPSGGGTAIVISGAGFTGLTVVNFGTVGVVPTLVLDNEVHVVSPRHAAGTVHLRVTSAGGTSPDTAADDFTFFEPGPEVCPEIPLWINDLAYGSPGGGFWWDPVSGLVWTGQRGWHLFAPQPRRPAPQPLWVNALTYGSPGGGFWWDPVSGLVWTGQRGWHAYDPQGCVAS